MATKTIDDNPSITDTVLFDLLTPDASGCFTSNPYKVNRVVVFFVERDFASGNTSEYRQTTYNTEKLQAAEAAEAVACADPTDENIKEAKRLREEADSNATTTPFFFNEAKPVHTVGNDQSPAWLSTDTENAALELVEEDDDGNPVYGHFTYAWEPKGMREGDYFICWTWTPNIAGDSLSSHLRFTLVGNTQVTTSIPTHYTDPEKYEALLDLYTPETFKVKLADEDRSPDVLEKFNGAVAQGFTLVEDLANQMVDLLDGNSIHEALLPYLSNLFDLRLKTADPTRWRRQIKRAVPLFKAKGTKKALAEALDHAGINLIKFTQLWQVVSSYTWQEVFDYEGELTFTLEKVALEVDQENFDLWLRPGDEDEWTNLSSDYVTFETEDGVTTMTWIGDTLSVNPIDLVEGDSLRVLYKYSDIPGSTEQAIENYVRELPLQDQRDERSQIYPMKNWNVRVIAGDDPMFNLVIPTRHPFYEPLVYGQVRTEFPYSENIYNMEEYNGSIRNSKLPCDIDRKFKDPCSACISSSYNIELEIEGLSNDRILEAREVLEEFTPFHAVLHTFSFLGGHNEFIQPPVEEIEMLATVHGSEIMIAGQAQSWFNRSMKLIATNGLYRDQLASHTQVMGATAGVVYNDEIVIFCPTVKFDKIGMNQGGAYLKILPPSGVAGTYSVENPRGNVVGVAGATEPIDDCDSLFAADSTINGCAFTFTAYNQIMTGTLCNVTQDNIHVFSDVNQNFGVLGVKSTWDVDHGDAASAWKVSIPAYSAIYPITNVMSDGSLILENDGSLPTSNTVNEDYAILNESDTVILEASAGKIVVNKRAKIQALSSTDQPIGNVVKVGYYMVISGEHYKVSSIAPGTDDMFYILDYEDGDAAGVNLDIIQYIAEREVGYFSHRGLKARLSGDLETTLEIQDGHNSLTQEEDRVENDHFMENFLVVVDGEDAYFMADIDGNSPAGYTTITLEGPDHYWGTFPSGGTAKNITIYRYTKEEITVIGQQFDLPPHTFRTYDRAGRPVITVETEQEDGDSEVSSLSLPEGNVMSEETTQNEGITFQIEYLDGTTEEGAI